jgi:murein DD-endopeptidase MepM/ murein hydrolase activator NlpD
MGIGSGDIAWVDLSAGNQQIQQLINESESAVAEYIRSEIVAVGKKIGAGGYRENRLWYQRSALFGATADLVPDDEKRCIHLGIDFWADAGTSIHLPLDGEVWTAVNNAKYLDYGPTLIFKHHIEEITFFSLFGHLSKTSLSVHPTGTKVEAGALIASLGVEAENGGWPPHLHYQIIFDLSDRSGDYPGVCTRKNEEFFSVNCPDPLPFSGLGRE